MAAGPKTACRTWENLTRARAWRSKLPVAGNLKEGAGDGVRVVPRLGEVSLFTHGYKRVTCSVQCFPINVPILAEFRSSGNHRHLF